MEQWRIPEYQRNWIITGLLICHCDPLHHVVDHDLCLVLFLAVWGFWDYDLKKDITYELCQITDFIPVNQEIEIYLYVLWVLTFCFKKNLEDIDKKSQIFLG